MKGALSDRGVVSPEWESSPCSQCTESWCCTWLTVHKCTLDRKPDLDQAQIWLQHEDILLGLQDNGIWSVHLNRPCRFLKDQRCSIHGSEKQPWICRRFSPHTCWYRRAFPGTASLLLLQFDRDRLLWLIGQLRFTTDGEIEETPSWEEMQKELASRPLKKVLPSESLKSPLEFPTGPLISERDRDLLKYKEGFPGVKLSPDGKKILISSLNG